MKNSKVLSENELGLLRKSVIPRSVNRESLKDSSEMFNIRIQLFTIIIDEQYSKSKTALKPDVNWLLKLGCSITLGIYESGEHKTVQEFGPQKTDKRCINLDKKASRR